MIGSGTVPTEPSSLVAPSRPADRPDAPAPDRSHALEVEQIRLLYASAPTALVASTVCAATLAAVEWTVSPCLPLLAWLAYMSILTAVRALLVRHFQRSPSEEQSKPLWKALFLAGAALAGLGWGSTMLLLPPPSSVPHQIFLVFMLGGITAGAVSTLSARLEAFLCFALPTLAPAVWHFLISPDTLAPAMAAMLVVFTVAMIYVATRVHGTIARSLSLRFENASLLERMASHALQQEVATEALRRSEQRYHALYDDTPSMYFTVSPDGTVLSVNRFGADYLGYRPDELIGKSVTTVLHPEDRALASRQLEACLQQPDRLARCELRKMRKDGSLLWVKETLRTARDSNGRLVVLIVCEDITEQKQAEERLRAATQKLEALIQTSPLAIMSLDTTGDAVVRWNRAAEEMFGWRAQEVLGRPFPNIPLGQEEESNALWEQAVRDGCLRGVELRRLRKDGTLIDVALWVTIVKDAQGRIVDTFGIVEDITERKRAQAALQHSQDRLQRALREREQLARNLHDNIIQSIYAIGFTLEECQELLNGAPADINRKLDQVIAELNRIIREVRGYLATPVEESDTLSADELMASLRRMGRLMESTDGMRFSLTIDPAAASLLTANQRAQFLYVAQEAMSNSLRHSGAKTVRVSLTHTPRGIRLEIRDDGKGFALPQLRGDSGGLKNIRVRARTIGANLDIASQPMRGTVVSLEMPIGA